MFKKTIALFLIGAGLTLSVQAQDLAVKIDNETTTLQADGVTRITRFSERLVRRNNQSWVARILPVGAHEDADHHGADKGHKHMDVNAAARWVLKGEDGKLHVRIVNEHEKMVVDVSPVDYGNIGFDGKWSSASQLMDAEQIKRMKTSSRAAPVGTRWVEGGARDVKVQVLWDEQAQYPRRIESANAKGTYVSTMVVTREAMPAQMPWAKTGAYKQKEYSDLLD